MTKHQTRLVFYGGETIGKLGELPRDADGHFVVRIENPRSEPAAVQVALVGDLDADGTMKNVSVVGEWQKVAGVLVDVAVEDSTLWWLSYAGDEGFRGVVIIEASDFISACRRSAELGLSPGGEVSGHDVPRDIPVEEQPNDLRLTLDPANHNRLILIDELRTVFGAKKRSEWEEG